MNREWLVKNAVTSDLKPPLGASRLKNKVPFTDEELERIIQACDRLDRVSWSNGLGKGVWTGEDVEDFIWVPVYTGLRISDVALFDMSRLRGNEVFLRAKKNGGDVCASQADPAEGRELVLRTSLGAAPGRLARQLLTEVGPVPLVVSRTARTTK